MDKGFLGGIVGGMVMLIVSIMLSGPLKAFVNGPSFLIVLGGATASVFVAFPVDSIKRAMVMAKGLIKKEPLKIKSTVEEFVKYSESVKKNGKMALEQIKTEDRFLQKGVNYILDNKPVDMLQKMLEQEREAYFEAEMQSSRVFDKMADYSPAWGMIGTLVGLVIMMLNLSDPSAIGPSMAVALITTFYGALFANLFFMPIAAKLELHVKELFVFRELVLEGIISLAKEEGPRVTEDRLMAFIQHDAVYRRQLEKEMKTQKKG